MREQCWYMMAFHERRCLNQAEWKSPGYLAEINTFLAQVRWCNEHRHENDVPDATEEE